MASPKYPKIAQLRTVEKLQQHLSQLQISLPCDSDLLSASEESPLGQSIKIGSYTAGNRWCIHPMEGWDANRDGSPTHLTIRRWERFGQSGAKLIWGGEAAAVQPRGRANPNQTLAMTENESGLRTLLESLVNAHRAQGDSADDLVVGLQLTASPMITRNGSLVSPTTIPCSTRNLGSIPRMIQWCLAMTI